MPHKVNHFVAAMQQIYIYLYIIYNNNYIYITIYPRNTEFLSDFQWPLNVQNEVAKFV